MWIESILLKTWEDTKMKQAIIILLLVLIPIILMSSVFDYRAIMNSLQFNYPQFDRTWRLNNILGEQYSQDTWNQTSRQEFVYNDTYPNRVDTLKTYFYDDTNSEWLLSMKISYTYEATGQNVTSAIYSFIMMGDEYPVMRLSAQYNNQNRITILIMESSGMFGRTWTLTSRVEFFYNANSFNHVVTYEVDSGLDRTETWDYVTYTNDGSGRPTIIVTQTSSDSTNWENSKKEEITYNPNDTSTGEDFIQVFSNMLTMMMSMNDGAYIYNNIMISEQTNQIYATDWVNETREVYSYDAQNKLTEMIGKLWQDGWVDDSQTLFTYNAQGNVYQSFENSWDGTAWTSQNRYTYNWGESTANEDNTTPVVSAINIATSPNPFAGEMSIRVNSKNSSLVKISVFNTKGQLINTLSAKSNTTINWNGKDLNNNNVSNGIYFIKADIAGSSKTTKVLKLK